MTLFFELSDNQYERRTSIQRLMIVERFSFRRQYTKCVVVSFYRYKHHLDASFAYIVLKTQWKSMQNMLQIKENASPNR